jgi:hypothetical protein
MRCTSISPNTPIGTRCACCTRASTTSESEVETAISLLLEQSQVPTFDAVRDLVRVPQIPALSQMHVNLQAYDQLLSSQQRSSHA